MAPPGTELMIASVAMRSWALAALDECLIARKRSFGRHHTTADRSRWQAGAARSEQR